MKTKGCIQDVIVQTIKVQGDPALGRSRERRGTITQNKSSKTSHQNQDGASVHPTIHSSHPTILLQSKEGQRICWSEVQAAHSISPRCRPDCTSKSRSRHRRVCMANLHLNAKSSTSRWKGAIPFHALHIEPWRYSLILKRATVSKLNAHRYICVHMYICEQWTNWMGLFNCVLGGVSQNIRPGPNRGKA